MLWSAEIANVQLVKDFKKAPGEQHYFTEECCATSPTGGKQEVNENLMHRRLGCSESTWNPERAPRPCRCFYGTPRMGVHGSRSQILIDRGSEGAA